METKHVATPGSNDTSSDTSIIFSLLDKKGALMEVLQQFKIADVNLTHIESRPSKSNPGKQYDFFTHCGECSQEKVDHLLGLLKPLVTSVVVKEIKDEVVWFPHTIYDLDKFATQVIDYGEDLGSDHPGVKDPAYCKRRKEIGNIAFNYKQSQPIPTVEYTAEEIQTWRLIFQGLIKLHPTNACQQYNRSFLQLVKTCRFCEDSIPQLETVSQYLKQSTGFQLRPAAGLWTSRDFLSALAFRVFPCTQYIRHSSKPFYTPEPDICHEMIGHVPLLADPTFASFSQEIGLASLGAPDEYIKKLATFYWFTMEFGVCSENGQRKAYGAGLLGSVEEIQYFLTDKPTVLPFEPEKIVVQDYPMLELQPLYFLADSFASAQEKLKAYAATIPKPFILRYNPYTQSVEELDNKSSINKLVSGIQADAELLQQAVHKVI